MWSVQSVILAIFIICITYLLIKWKNAKSNHKLPPGSMGLPLIGETIDLIVPGYSLDVSPFIKRRLQRYGPIFRTKVATRPVVLSADPEFNHFILLQEGKLVEAWYLDLFAKVFAQGENKPNGAQIHKYIRNLALSHFGAESLKTKLLAQLEQMVNTTLSSWSSCQSIEVKRSASIMALEYGSKQLFSFDNDKVLKELSDKYINFSKGIMSFPVNIPGTAYHQCLKDHKKALKILMNVLTERRDSLSSGVQYGDALDQMIEDVDQENFLTDKFIVQIMYGLLFVTFDSVSLALTLAFKLLAENPLVLEEMTAEHEALVKGRENPDSPITWEEYKSMTFTLNVINETLRFGSATPGLLRRAREDIQVNGYTIPKGWAIMVLHSATQLDADTFEDPLAFNPWRWKDMKPNVASKYFMPFGGGMRQCAGAEYTRVLLSVFFHVLVSKYKWTKIEGGEVVRNPILQIRNGLKIKISKK